MSKTFTPIHSDQPEERFVVEKATMEKPVTLDYIHNNHYVDALDKYNEHIKSLTKYHFPSLTREMPDELVEGRDFELGMQRFIDGLDKWVDCEKVEYDSISWQLHQSHRRIIAVPISVKTEPAPSVESMEDVLKDALSKDGLGISLSTEDRILSAMQHWASIKCAEKDREIAELRQLKEVTELALSSSANTIEDMEQELSTKEEAVKELVEGLDEASEYLNETMYEKGKPVQLNYIGAGSKLHNNFKQLITKHKTP